MGQFSSEEGGYYNPPYSNILVPYNKTGNDLYYILGELNTEHTIGLFKFDLSTRKVYNISINNYSISTNWGYSCLIIIPTDINRKVLGCFYHSSDYNMRIKYLDVQNNLNELTDYYFQESVSTTSNLILSKSDENKKKVLLALYVYPDVEFKIYDVDSKKLIDGGKLENTCNDVTFI